jgi:peroxiredoxin
MRAIGGGFLPLLLSPIRQQPCSHLAVMNIKQASQIEVEQTLPAAYVEIVTDGCAADDNCAVRTADEVLGSGKCVLVGMPGAFTPTCTDEHLPGFIRSAKKFKRLGVKKVCIVTTNDRFIMTAWKKAMRECMQAEGLSSMDTQVEMLSDDKGEFIKSMGLAYNLQAEKKSAWSFQLNAGLRSKRFAMVTNGGVVEHLAVDDGDTEMVDTSAERVLDLLTPQASAVQQATASVEPEPLLTLLAAAALLAVAYSYYPSM